MELLAMILAVIMTFMSTVIILTVLTWLGKAIVLFIICRKHDMPTPWIVFIPICTDPYMGFMVSKIWMWLNIGTTILLVLSAGLPYISLFVAILIIHLVILNIIYYNLFQNNKLYTIVTIFLPMLAPIFLIKVYLKKKVGRLSGR